MAKQIKNLEKNYIAIVYKYKVHSHKFSAHRAQGKRFSTFLPKVVWFSLFIYLCFSLRTSWKTTTTVYTPLVKMSNPENTSYQNIDGSEEFEQVSTIQKQQLILYETFHKAFKK